MDSGSSAAGGGFLPADSAVGCGVKVSKLWDEDDGGMDELLAMLGYKVRSSDMAEVAQKLEQLEEAMCSVQYDNLSQLASDTVHYNPSDLSTWLESMLTKLNPPPNFDTMMAGPEGRREIRTQSPGTGETEGQRDRRAEGRCSMNSKLSWDYCITVQSHV